ncbi:MAG: hypothetical protein H0X33_13510 [Taibaiella sp.]|nr:hypothetical protein [Taibaiella sp.]
MPEENYYPGFNIPASQLSKFINATDLFTMMLKDKRVIHHTPENAENFRKWLLLNSVEDIKTQKNSQP